MDSKRYESDALTVEYDLRRCIHAAECVRALPAVFDTSRRPWIDPARADAAAIVEVIHLCPSGALHYRRKDGGPEEAPDSETTVSVVPDGPLYLRGPLRIHRPDGTVVEETRAALCRCGRSKRKPWCDNSHREAGFRDPGVLGDGRAKPDDGTAGAVVEITPKPNGSLRLDGRLTIVGADGQSVGGAAVSLCRCGASARKPYCDGTHKRIGFEAD